MNSLTRDMSTTERVLFVVLGLMLIGAAYYFFVHMEVTSAIDAAHAERDAVVVELDAQRKHLMELRNMENEMDALETSGSLARMESYNNSKAEIALLNDILSVTNGYAVTAGDLTRHTDQIRRTFRLSFKVDSFETAEKVITQLSESECRCLLSDMTCKADGKGMVDFTLMATFFETMVGGEADAGLPPDLDIDKTA